MLEGYAAAQRRDAVYRPVRNRLGVIEEPIQAGEGNIAIDAFEHIERARNGLVIGRVQPPRPTILRENAHDFFQFAFHLRRHVRPRLAEVSKSAAENTSISPAPLWRK